MIALVISIIVMLILAGVSINALVGDDGILSRTQYSTFLSEMTAVEEAVQMWKAGEAIGTRGEEKKEIPVNGMCKVNDLTKTERLVGEIGYYRIWSMSETIPSTSVLSSSAEFNGAFEGEMIYYPAGVQDLYYLDNEAIGIEGNKSYVIDAATGMIYSMAGVTLKGVSCYSANMATAVMSGNLNAPIFAESEVSGTGIGDKLAGNTGTEYLEDGSKNPNYKEYGFQIIADPASNNIFKLYNNGDLYGKGIKGTQLNTSSEQMEKINQYVWKEWKVPTEVGEYKKIIIGISGAMYFIDSNDDLWVYGNNRYNKFGLTSEQQVEYTGREPMKVDLNGKKVSRVFAGNNSTFIITKDNCLLAAGINTSGQLGLGDTRTTLTFEQVNVANAQNIEMVYCSDNHTNANIIKYNDNTFYFAGNNGFGGLGTGSYGESYNTFTQVWNGVVGPDIDQDIKDIMWDCQNIILKKDGTVWVAGYTGYLMGNLPNGSSYVFRKHNIDNVKAIYKTHTANILLEKANELYCMASNSNNFGIDYLNTTSPVKMELPSELQNEGIKECYMVGGAAYVLSNAGKLYGTGSKIFLGLNETTGYTQKLQKLNIDNVDTMYGPEIDTGSNEGLSIVLLSKGGKYYTTGNATLMFSNDIVQKNWTVVASNVKYFDALSTSYVDRDGNLWSAGDSRTLGMGDVSKTYKNITNYTKVNDSNINGKVEKSWNVSGMTYVLLKNKELWATGMYGEVGAKYFPGWSENENKSNFVKILDNVEYFSARIENTRFAICSNNQCYVWGQGTSSCLGGNGLYNIQTPTSYDLPTEINGVSNVNYLHADSSYHSHLLTNTGEIFRTGKNNGYAYYGAPNGSRAGGSTSLSKYAPAVMVLDNNEKVIKFLDNQVTAMILTSKGRLFGYGVASMLGIGNSTDELMETREITGITDVIQLVQGSGWFVAIKADGTVWGTGSNQYGVLGRWIGIDRKSPNSRYKTAFEWVECPELEI